MQSKTAAESAKQPFDNDAVTLVALDLKKKPGSIRLQGQFYELMQPMVEATVNTFASDVEFHTKKDLVQDALLKLIVKIDKFKPRNGRLHSWSTQIIRNLCFDYYRRNKRNKLNEDISGDAVSNLQAKETASLTDDSLLSEIRSFLPFYCPASVFYEIFEVLEGTNFNVNHTVVKNVNRLCRKHKIPTDSYGSINELVQFLIALIRGWLAAHNPDAGDALLARMESSKRLTPVRALMHYLGAKRTAVVIHVLGGLTVRIPTAAEILADDDPEFR